jgi:hypothetical protein
MELNESQKNVLRNLDKLKALIENVRSKGQFTTASEYEVYYNEVRDRPRIKELIKGTQHEN